MCRPEATHAFFISQAAFRPIRETVNPQRPRASLIDTPYTGFGVENGKDVWKPINPPQTRSLPRRREREFRPSESAASTKLKHGFGCSQSRLPFSDGL
ncbi:hypothetical protein [Kingella potus]|uniref:hypothetical protein n=1 Tax=Kingella potus TaxID=265175 RepID=UPI001FD12826|nr:hypothetical protein [Kingella potus]UOP01076.1 hypothetical protein LVJ84_01580 [Kingella potus]